jgi:hypothetical protein
MYETREGRTAPNRAVGVLRILAAAAAAVACAACCRPPQTVQGLYRAESVVWAPASKGSRSALPRTKLADCGLAHLPTRLCERMTLRGFKVREGRMIPRFASSKRPNYGSRGMDNGWAGTI